MRKKLFKRCQYGGSVGIYDSVANIDNTYNPYKENLTLLEGLFKKKRADYDTNNAALKTVYESLKQVEPLFTVNTDAYNRITAGIEDEITRISGLYGGDISKATNELNGLIKKTADQFGKHGELYNIQMDTNNYRSQVKEATKEGVDPYASKFLIGQIAEEMDLNGIYGRDDKGNLKTPEQAKKEGFYQYKVLKPKEYDGVKFMEKITNGVKALDLDKQEQLLASNIIERLKTESNPGVGYVHYVLGTETKSGVSDSRVIQYITSVLDEELKGTYVKEGLNWHANHLPDETFQGYLKAKADNVASINSKIEGLRGISSIEQLIEFNKTVPYADEAELRAKPKEALKDIPEIIKQLELQADYAQKDLDATAKKGKTAMADDIFNRDYLGNYLQAGKQIHGKHYEMDYQVGIHDDKLWDLKRKREAEARDAANKRMLQERSLAELRSIFDPKVAPQSVYSTFIPVTSNPNSPIQQKAIDAFLILEKQDPQAKQVFLNYLKENGLSDQDFISVLQGSSEDGAKLNLLESNSPAKFKENLMWFLKRSGKKEMTPREEAAVAKMANAYYTNYEQGQAKYNLNKEVMKTKGTADEQLQIRNLEVLESEDPKNLIAVSYSDRISENTYSKLDNLSKTHYTKQVNQKTDNVSYVLKNPNLSKFNVMKKGDPNVGNLKSLGVIETKEGNEVSFLNATISSIKATIESYDTKHPDLFDINKEVGYMTTPNITMTPQLSKEYDNAVREMAQSAVGLNLNNYTLVDRNMQLMSKEGLTVEIDRNSAVQYKKVIGNGDNALAVNVNYKDSEGKIVKQGMIFMDLNILDDPKFKGAINTGNRNLLKALANADPLNTFPDGIKSTEFHTVNGVDYSLTRNPSTNIKGQGQNEGSWEIAQYNPKTGKYDLSPVEQNSKTVVNLKNNSKQYDIYTNLDNASKIRLNSIYSQVDKKTKEEYEKATGSPYTLFSVFSTAMVELERKATKLNSYATTGQDYDLERARFTKDLGNFMYQFNINPNSHESMLIQDYFSVQQTPMKIVNESKTSTTTTEKTSSQVSSILGTANQ